MEFLDFHPMDSNRIDDDYVNHGFLSVYENMKVPIQPRLAAHLALDHKPVNEFSVDMSQESAVRKNGKPYMFYTNPHGFSTNIFTWKPESKFRTS